MVGREAFNRKIGSGRRSGQGTGGDRDGWTRTEGPREEQRGCWDRGRRWHGHPSPASRGGRTRMTAEHLGPRADVDSGGEGKHESSWTATRGPEWCYVAPGGPAPLRFCRSLLVRVVPHCDPLSIPPLRCARNDASNHPPLLPFGPPVLRADVLLCAVITHSIAHLRFKYPSS